MKLICCEFGDHPAIKFVMSLLYHQTAALNSSFASLESHPTVAYAWKWSVHEGAPDRGDEFMVAILHCEDLVAFMEEFKVSRDQTIMIATDRQGERDAGARLSASFRTGAEPIAVLHGTDSLNEEDETQIIGQLVRAFVSEAEAYLQPGYSSRTLCLRGRGSPLELYETSRP